MDKDLLRIVIIAAGAVVILGIIIWTMITRSKHKKNNFYGDGSLEKINPNLVMNTKDDDFDIIPINPIDNSSSESKYLNTNYMRETQQSEVSAKTQTSNATEEQTATSDELPHLLQLSIAAKTAEGFSGSQLLEAFESVGLIYGSVEVFEKLDELNRVDYAVASMTKPGIFPSNNWETYLCPGVTFFMQPREVENAAQVFDEMIATIHQLSATLQGHVLDEDMQHLTEATVQKIKASLV